MAEFDWKQIAGPLITTGGTVLGGIIGGPAGAVVGPMIGQALGSVLGVDATPEAVSTALQQPGAAEKIAAAQAQIATAATAAQDAYLADVANARQQTIELARQGSNIAWSASIISGIIVVGFFVVLGALVSHVVPDSQILLVMLGALVQNFGQVCNYWIGSSKGSADKTDAITAIVRKAIPH